MDVDAYRLKELKNCVLKWHGAEDKIDEDQLRLYFHLIAAAQGRINISDKDPATLTAFTNLKFKKKSPQESQSAPKLKEEVKTHANLQKGNIHESVSSNEGGTEENLYPEVVPVKKPEMAKKKEAGKVEAIQPTEPSQKKPDPKPQLAPPKQKTSNPTPSSSSPSKRQPSSLNII